MADIQICPGCRAALPASDGPVHRYLGASAACWAVFGALVNAGEPPMTPAPHNRLLIDAYASQHPGVPSPQSIQSVAVHLLALHGYFVRDVAPEHLLRLRQRALAAPPGQKHGRFVWLEPPDFSGSITVAEIAALPTPATRTALAARYLDDVWARWCVRWGDTVGEWYDRYVVQ